VLDPKIKKGPWTYEDDEQVFSLYKKFGKSWSKIAQHMNGRTEN
jgi:Myb-like DNA-binding protein BAS1